jgi:hypothetical protein
VGHCEQKREGYETAVRIEKNLCTVLYQAHLWQVEEAINTLSKGPDGFCASPSG